MYRLRVWEPDDGGDWARLAANFAFLQLFLELRYSYPDITVEMVSTKYSQDTPDGMAYWEIDITADAEQMTFILLQLGSSYENLGLELVKSVDNE